MGKLVIYDTNDFDLFDLDYDMDFFKRELPKSEKMISMFNGRGDAAAALNAELSRLCYKAKHSKDFARETYIRQARAMRQIIIDVLGV